MAWLLLFFFSEIIPATEKKEIPVHPNSHAEDEFEITGDLPSEPCAVLTFPQDRNPAPSHLSNFASAENEALDDDEPTIVEALKKPPSRSPFYQFIFSPHYKTAFSVDLHRYLRQVRSRMENSRNSHRDHFPNSGFQRLNRLIRRAVERAKRNLAVK